MTTIATATQSAERRDVRTLLIQQQRAVESELALPAILRAPAIVLLWFLALIIVVAALALGRVRVPRLTHGVVVSANSATTGVADSLTPVLLLPRSVGSLVTRGQLARVDTGGTEPLTLSIVEVQSPHRGDTPAMRINAERPDSPTVARLERCRSSQCLVLSHNARYPAVATLGLRTLASFVMPRS